MTTYEMIEKLTMERDTANATAQAVQNELALANDFNRQYKAANEELTAQLAEAKRDGERLMEALSSLLYKHDGLWFVVNVETVIDRAAAAMTAREGEKP